MGVPTDEELVERWRSVARPQQETLLNQLFERHHTRVAAWCYRMTSDLDAATDLAQEVFLKAFQRMDSFRGQSKFTTWLYSIARNLCMDALRSRAAGPTLAGDAVLDQVEDVRAGELLLTMERHESEQIVRQLMREALDATETQVMMLHYVEEVPLDVITRMLNLTNASGAKAYVVSSRRKLVRAFSEWKAREEQRKGGGHAESRT